MSEPLTAPKPSAIVRAHAHVDRLFARWAKFSFRHPWLIIFCWVAIVGGFSTQLGKITVETSAESFVHEDDPARIAYNHFRYQFGRDERILVMVESPSGDIFNLPFLNQLKALHEALEQEVPKVVAVDSLINARQTRGEADELIVEDFLED
ncbi:MAG: Fis family transcriptional regulator, partial [Gammaproteobacteria bacterium]